jgi:glycosyltransferase involved in cell wall biosynthesis
MTAEPYPSVTDLVRVTRERSYQAYYSLSLENQPVVSIISSFYNAHKYFEETYINIINQSLQDFEWVIVDDCSSDPEALALFESLPERSPKIRVFRHQVNRGLAAGRNTAIAQARGKYLFFMDLDDLIDPTYLEKCILFLEANPEFSFVNSYAVGFQDIEYWWPYGFSAPTKFIDENPVTAMLVYRKSDFNELGGFDENLRFYEDWERWLRAIANHQKGWTIPEYLHFYRRTKLGLLSTSRSSVEEKQVKELILSRYRKFFETNHLSSWVPEKHPCSASKLRFKFSIKNKLERRRNGKRVLCFFPWLEVGGADKFNLDLVGILTQRGYDVTILTTLKSEHPWHQHFHPITPDIFHLHNLLDDSYWLAFTRYIIESRQIDSVFIAHCQFPYYLLPCLRIEFPEVAFIDFTHVYDPTPWKDWREGGYLRLSCQFTQVLDVQLVTSEYLAECYRRTEPRTESKLRVLYTNLDTRQWVRNLEKRNFLRLSLDIPEHVIVLLFPARIVAQKRPTFLVDIAKALVTQNLPICVITLGEGNLLAEMQAKIQHLGLRSFFRTLPPVEPERMIDFYSVADILLLPTEFEGIALAIYEAMSMNLPVVASDVGGQHELVVPGTGFLVPKGEGDSAEVQAYLEVLLPLITDADLRYQVGALARKRVAESFSLESMGARMESIFAEAIEIRKSKLVSEEINSSLAEEMLTLLIEYCRLEQYLKEYYHQQHIRESYHTALSQLQQTQAELERVQTLMEAMESSKFWKFRNLWFRLKRLMGLTSSSDLIT